jgi:hypothetical protein
MVVDDTTRMKCEMKVRKPGQRTREGHYCVKQTKEEMICGTDEFLTWSEIEMWKDQEAEG